MSKPYGLMADLHLHNWSSFSTSASDGINSRLKGLLTEIHRCPKHVKDAAPHTIVKAGDIFHVRGSVAPSVLNPTIDALDTIHRVFGVRFIIIPGNHDLEGKNTTRLGSAVTALARDYIAIENDPSVWNAGSAVLFPWYESTKELLAKMQEYASFRDDLGPLDAIIHAPIDGVISGLPGHGLTPEVLAKLGYRRVFAGHYHHHKAFEGGAVSIGALAHHTWSDVGTKAGFLIVDPTSDAFTYRKSHLPEFIDLAKLVTEMEIDPADVPLMVDGHYVRVKVEASKSKEVEAAREELLKHGAKAVVVQAEPKPPAELVRGDHSVKAGESLEVSVSEFVKSMKDVAEQAAVTAAALSVLGSVATIR
jgi:DNA repair exonuclease SbcCD nuclease subunit